MGAHDHVTHVKNSRISIQYDDNKYNMVKLFSLHTKNTHSKRRTFISYLTPEQKFKFTVNVFLYLKLIFFVSIFYYIKKKSLYRKIYSLHEANFYFLSHIKVHNGIKNSHKPGLLMFTKPFNILFLS